jgi:hypothetical protein
MFARGFSIPVAALLLLLAAAPWHGVARAAGPTIENVEAGFQGTIKVGYFAPLRLQITAGDEPLDAELEILAPDGDGLMARHVVDGADGRIRLAAGQTRKLVRYVKIGRLRGDIVLRLVAGDQPLASATVSLKDDVRTLFSTQHWLLVLGADIDFQQTIQRTRGQARQATIVTTIAGDSTLPDSWLAYDGVNMVVLPTSRPELVDSISADQLRALRVWIEMGGRLILSVGARGQDVIGTNGPLRSLAPGDVLSITRPRQAPGLETFAHAEEPLSPFSLSVVTAPPARVAAYVEGRGTDDHPAVIRSPFGFGEVVFVAFDIDQPPVSGWQALSELLDVVVQRQVDRESTQRENETRRVRHIGYDELSGQLRSALDYFPATAKQTGIGLVSFWTVFALICVYIALVGPGDYFLLRRVVGRMEWTWLTFPLLLVMTCAVIYGLSGYWRGGSQLRVNQVDLVDVDIQQGLVRGTTWAHIFSPTTTSYDVRMKPAPPWDTAVTAAEEGSLVTWHGLPGSGFGGFDTAAVEVLTTEPYRVISAPDKTRLWLNQLPIRTSSTQSVVGRWWQRSQLPSAGELTADENGFLHGTLVNLLTVPLEDGVLIHDRWAYRLDRTLQPGQSLRVDGLERRDLQWLLTRRRVLQGKTSYASTPWEAESRDVPRVLEIMMFHSAAGGPTYTGLGQNYQDFVDLSDQLMLGRAILLGSAAAPAAQLDDRDRSLTDTADRHWTWFRLLLPVQPKPVESSEGALH